MEIFQKIYEDLKIDMPVDKVIKTQKINKNFYSKISQYCQVVNDLE